MSCGARSPSQPKQAHQNLLGSIGNLTRRIGSPGFLQLYSPVTRVLPPRAVAVVAVARELSQRVSSTVVTPIAKVIMRELAGMGVHGEVWMFG